jgi:hypothetical protein
MQIESNINLSNCIIRYNIVREERVTFDGKYIIVNEPNQFFYTIDSITGIITSKFQNKNFQMDYTSILVVVLVKDLTTVYSPAECNFFLLNLNCEIIFLIIHLKGSVDFRFILPIQNKIPHFIGGGERSENICEDVPINNEITQFRAFDSTSQSQRSLCFLIDNNDFFKFLSIQRFSAPITTTNGIIALKESFLNYKINNFINLTSFLYYCNDPTLFKLDKQTISFNIKSVNKYAPEIIEKNSQFEISSTFNSNYSTIPINIIDNDTPPYNSFKCNIENDNNNNFNLINSMYDQTITILYLKKENNFNFVDLSIKCCDDTTKWIDNKCFSTPKCSLTSIRIKSTGHLKKEETKQNKVSCYNGLESELCKVNTNILPTTLLNNNNNNYKPLWRFPNPNSCLCISVRKDLPTYSLILNVKAVVVQNGNQIESSSNGIIYSFAYQGLLYDTITDFKFLNQTSGQIYLINSLNNSKQNEIREVINNLFNFFINKNHFIIYN